MYNINLSIQLIIKYSLKLKKNIITFIITVESSVKKKLNNMNKMQ